MSRSFDIEKDMREAIASRPTGIDLDGNPLQIIRFGPPPLSFHRDAFAYCQVPMPSPVWVIKIDPNSHLGAVAE